MKVRRGCHPWYKANARCTLSRRDGSGMWWGRFGGLGNPGDMFATTRNSEPPDEWMLGRDDAVEPL